MKFNKLIPEIIVSNIEKSLVFYKNIGFKIEYGRKENKFVFISLEKSQIMLQEKNGVWETGKLEYPFGRGINLQIEVKSINLIIKKLKKFNYPLFIAPNEKWYRVNKKLFGSREFLVKDPDGYLLRFFEDLGSKNFHN